MWYNLTSVEAARTMSGIVRSLNQDIWQNIFGILILLIFMIVLYSSMTNFPHTERMVAVTFLNMILSWLGFILGIVDKITPFVSIFLFMVSAIMLYVANRS